MTGQAEAIRSGAHDELPPAYQPAVVEGTIYRRWLDADAFAPDGAGSRADFSRPPFVVTMPPPNVTGALHLGHALRVTIEDALIRHARMQRRPALWVPGVDHASIAAHVVLDRIIATERETRASLGRERYLERMWRFMDETRDVMSGQMQRLGASADWSRGRFTMDDVSARAVRTSFRRLYEEGLAYRAEALINWCPSCRTSLSDLEVVPTPEHGTIWSLRYHLVDEGGAPDSEATITVATTRPETLLGDTAVAVHPEDERYRELLGRRVLIPFVERVVPIIADEGVERGFGTGAVKVTPAHDGDDYAIGKRHGLAMINVLEDDGRINAAGAVYAGLDRYEARRRILADLAARNDLVETRPHEMLIGRCQRSDDAVEPRLKTSWFIRTRPLAALAMAAVREGRTRILPRRFEKVFFDWLEKIHDWNVSRQLWWGHRIPAWYCPDDHVTVSDAAKGPEVCGTCGRPAVELRQDEDIFDTWYSSGLWPFSTLGWPEETDDLRRFYPTSVMETGYDIIFFWVARMMMLGEWLTAEAPFHTVLLGGMVRDPYGQKMSKTKGNVIDPLGVIDELGADSLRLALVHGTTPGNDLRLGRAKLEGARNFANKLWNAARFVLGERPEHLPPGEPLTLPADEDLGPAERWILSRCGATIGDVSRAYEEFQHGEAARLLQAAIWGEYCDWYLELAKVRLASASTSERVATWRVLAWVLDRYLRLLHPLMPFITEAIWSRLPHAADDPDLLMVADWPTLPAELPGARREQEAFEELLDLIRAIRNARVEGGIEPAVWLEAHLLLGEEGARIHNEIGEAVARLGRVRPVTVHRTREDFGRSGGEDGLTILVGATEARLARGRVDRRAERERMERDLKEAEALLAAAESKLANRAFVERAPASVVQAARDRAQEMTARLARLREQMEA